MWPHEKVVIRSPDKLENNWFATSEIYREQMLDDNNKYECETYRRHRAAC